MTISREGRIAMAQRIAAEETFSSDEALSNLDQAVDTIIGAIGVIDQMLPFVKPETDKEREAIDKVKDLVDTAIAPYMADIAKAMDALDEGEAG